MPVVLDSLFHKVVNTTSSPIGVEGGVVVNHKVAGPSNSKKTIWPNDINSGSFWLYISQNVSTSVPRLTRQSCGDCLMVFCLVGQVGAIYRPPEHWWMPDKPMNEASVKADR